MKDKLMAFLAGLWPTNPGNRKAQIGVIVVIALVLAGLATQCRAAEGYSQFAAGSTIVRGHASAVDLALVYPRIGISDAGAQVGVTFVSESTYKARNQRNQFMWHASLVDGFGNLDVMLGAAYLQNVDIYNGSHTNFMLGVQYRVQRLPVTIIYRHFSNGGTQTPNIGRDMVMIGWRF